MNLATAYVELRADDATLKRDLDKVEGDTKKKAESLGRTFARVFSAAAFGLAIKKSVDAASDLNETVSKTRVIFGAAANEIEQMGDKAARSMGLSKRAYLDAASGLKGLLDNLGLASKESTQWSMDLTQLGSDLASFFNTDPAEAVQAIGAALRGEQEPIRRYNVNINEAAIKTKAFELGLYSGKGAIDQSAKAQATLALIMEQTSAAHGDFARTADGAANSQRIATAAAEDSAASLGQSFLPIYTRVVQIVTALAEGFGSLPAPIQLALVGLAAVVALSGPIGTFKDLVKGVTASFKSMGITATGASLAVGALGSVLAIGAFIYMDYAKQKAVAKQRTDDFVAALKAEQGGQVDATRAAIAAKIATADIARLTREYGVTTEQVADFITGKSVPALEHLVDQYGEMGVGLAGVGNDQAAAARGYQISARDAAALSLQLSQLRGSYADATEQVAIANAVSDELGVTVGGVTSEIDDQAESVDDLATAFAELLGTLDVNDAYRNALDSIDELGEAWTEAWAKGQTPEEAERSLRAYNQQLDDAKRDVITFGETLDGVASKERIAEILTMLDEGDLAGAQAAIDALTRDREVRVKVRVSGNTGIIQIAGIGEVEQYADGGIVNEATYMAGEAGREAVLPLTRPSRLAEILSDERVAGPVSAAMGGTGGINIHGDINVGSRNDYAGLHQEFERLLWRVAA